MALRFLLDTHIVIRMLIQPKKLSREQFRALDKARVANEPVGLSAVSLLEIALLTSAGKLRLSSLAEFLEEMRASPLLQVLPLSYEIAMEVGSLGTDLPDPADRAIVATARVHRLRLLTSDQRIVSSNLVPTVE